MEFVFDPKKLLNQINIEPGWTVADFGSGSGHLAVEIAGRVGDQGKVFALDILKPALESIRNLAKLHKISNIETRWTDIEKTSGLEKESCDLVVVANLLFQADQLNYSSILQEAARILKPNGRLLVVDWTKEATVGPEQSQRVGLEEIKNLGEGFFKNSEKIDGGQNHWGILFFK